MHGRKKSTLSPAGKWLRRFRQAALAALCVVGSVAAHATERQSIPFNVDMNGNIVVQLTLNDETPAIGVIDTAATYAMIGMATAKRAGVEPPDSSMVTILGLEGTRAYPIVYLDSIAAGNCRFIDVAAALNQRIEVTGVKNIVPLTVLEGDVVDFDFAEGRVLVYNGRPDTHTAQITSRLPMRQISGLWFTEVKLNGRKGLALIDTGSSVSYINSRFAEDADMTPNLQKTHILQGITGNGIDVRVATGRKIRLGKHTVSRPDMIVADPLLFEHLGLVDAPAMVMGLDYLSAFRVQLDRRRGYLVLTLQDGKRGTVPIHRNATGTNIRGD